MFAALVTSTVLDPQRVRILDRKKARLYGRQHTVPSLFGHQAARVASARVAGLVGDDELRRVCSTLPDPASTLPLKLDENALYVDRLGKAVVASCSGQVQTSTIARDWEVEPADVDFCQSYLDTKERQVLAERKVEVLGEKKVAEVLEDTRRVSAWLARRTAKFIVAHDPGTSYDDVAAEMMVSALRAARRARYSGSPEYLRNASMSAAKNRLANILRDASNPARARQVQDEDGFRSTTLGLEAAGADPGTSPRFWEFIEAQDLVDTIRDRMPPNMAAFIRTVVDGQIDPAFDRWLTKHHPSPRTSRSVVKLARVYYRVNRQRMADLVAEELGAIREEVG